MKPRPELDNGPTSQDPLVRTRAAGYHPVSTTGTVPMRPSIYSFPAFDPPFSKAVELLRSPHNLISASVVVLAAAFGIAISQFGGSIAVEVPVDRPAGAMASSSAEPPRGGLLSVNGPAASVTPTPGSTDRLHAPSPTPSPLPTPATAGGGGSAAAQQPVVIPRPASTFPAPLPTPWLGTSPAPPGPPPIDPSPQPPAPPSTQPTPQPSLTPYPTPTPIEPTPTPTLPDPTPTPDSDGDNVPDDEDVCPTVSWSPVEDPNRRGCPLIVLP